MMMTSCGTSVRFPGLEDTKRADRISVVDG
jgi:hypothetical protein